MANKSLWSDIRGIAWLPILIGLIFGFIIIHSDSNNVEGAVPKSMVDNGSDHVLWEAQRNEALAIGYGLDSLCPGTRSTITTGNNTDVAISPTTGYLLRAITINTDVWLTVTFTGTEIDASDGTNTVVCYLPAGSTTLDLTNVTSINYANSSGSTATVYTLPLTMQQKVNL